jgi:hypothetical protein
MRRSLGGALTRESALASVHCEAQSDIEPLHFTRCDAPTLPSDPFRFTLLPGWPEWARVVIGVGLMVAIVGGLLAIPVRLRWLTDEGLARIGTGRPPSVRRYISTILGALALTWLAAIWLYRRSGIPTDHTVIACIALFSGLASIGWPWWVFATARRFGPARRIKSDRALRLAFGVLAAVGVGVLLTTSR